MGQRYGLFMVARTKNRCIAAVPLAHRHLIANFYVNWTAKLDISGDY